MTGFEKLEKYTLLQQEEQHPLFTSYRAGEIEGGRLTQHVRLDIVNPQISANPGFIDQVMSQSIITSKLEHTNITKKISAVQQGTTLASAYEYLEGFSLQSVLDRSRSEGFPFSIDHALLVANKLANALAFAKSKNVHHGLVHPAFVFITNEGEIKTKGFALATALKGCIAANPQIEAFLSPYLPENRHAGDGSAERFDIFAAGIILFEMLTSQQFYASGRNVDAVQRIKGAETAAEMEAIPESIVKILISAIDPQSENAYSDVQSMAREIESLIFSGEYSPTTFNLAFFMHSAFRSDIEGINAQIKSEREQSFDAVPAPTAPVEQGAPPVSPAQYGSSGVVSAAAQPAQKSKTGLFIGIAVAAVAIIAVVVVLFLPKKDDASNVVLEQQEQELLRKRLAQEAESKQEEEEILRLQIETLRAQIEEQQRQDRNTEAEQVKNEIDQIDEVLETAKQRKALELQLEQQQKQLEELQRQSELEKQRLAQELEAERERARLQAEQQAKAEQEQQAEEPPPQDTKTEIAQSKPIEKQPVANKTTQNDSSSQPKKSVEQSQVAKKDVVPAQPPGPSKNVVATPPEEGELVEIDDTVTQPVLQDTLKYLPVPTKAVRSGTVRPGEVKTFLVRALVDERGRVQEVEMVRNPMASYEDDYDMPDKAIKHAKKLRFAPAEKMGVRVSVWTHIGIHFKAQ